jgi:hypothetical protein
MVVDVTRTVAVTAVPSEKTVTKVLPLASVVSSTKVGKKLLPMLVLRPGVSVNVDDPYTNEPTPTAGVVCGGEAIFVLLGIPELGVVAGCAVALFPPSSLFVGTTG